MNTACIYCQRELDPQARSTYRRVVGWERRAPLAGSRRGGHDIVGRETLETFACPVCVDRLRHGLAPAQETLL